MGPLQRNATTIALGLIGLAAPGMTGSAAAQTPMSQCSVLSGRPCHPSFCGVFHRGPCMPYYLPPIGEDLRLTVTSTDNNEHGTLPDGDADKAGTEQVGKEQGGGDQAAGGEGGDGTPGSDAKGLDSIRAMFAALRACWVPPPKDEARHGMEYTVRFAFKRDGDIMAPPRVTYVSHDAPAEARNAYRDAVNAALDRCTPLHFTAGMAGAVAGRPIAIRFVDNRTIDSRNSQQ